MIIVILGGFFLLSFREEKKSKLRQNKNIEFVTVGIPRPLAETRDYNVIFKELKEAGINGFLGSFLYQEVPEPKSLGYEADFLPPCTADMPSLKALRENQIQLLIPADVLYTPGNMPPIDQDPLKQLLACVGRNSVMGVLSYDEPVWNRIPLEAPRLLYKRVKEVDPSLPVFMVQAPLPAAADITEANYYFSEIKKYNLYADVIGFDVYPIPTNVALLSTPYTKGKLATDYKALLSDYLKWLKENAAGKPFFIALQAFSYDDLGTKGMGVSTVQSKKPTAVELADMIEIAKNNGVSYIAWFGPSYLTKEDMLFWQEVLASTKAFFAREQGAQ